jgi:hypothetical protein
MTQTVEIRRSIAPITVTGWRIYDLYELNDQVSQDVTRGVIVRLSESGKILPDKAKDVHARELKMILKEYGDQPLAIHLCTSAASELVPQLMNQFCQQFYDLFGRVFQINKPISAESAEELLKLKERYQLKVILQHYNLLSATPDDPRVELADQLLIDMGGGRGKQQVQLNEKTLQFVNKLLEVSSAPLGLAGRLSAQAVNELSEYLDQLAQYTQRPIAFDSESQMRVDSDLNLERIQEYTQACLGALQNWSSLTGS